MKHFTKEEQEYIDALVESITYAMTRAKEQTDEESKWLWKMDWCKREGLPAAQSCVWDKAEEAYQKDKEK